MRVSCSLAIAATRATGIAVANSISNASNSNVNPDSGRAQPTATRCTPCSGQRVRGTRACRNALYWKKSKCRHVLSSVSCTGQEPSSQPATEHPKRAPRGKSRYRSNRPCATSKSERVTRHGSPNPKAVLNRSRVSDIRPIPQHWATERHNPSWPTPRTPGRDTAKPTRSGEEPRNPTGHGVSPKLSPKPHPRKQHKGHFWSVWRSSARSIRSHGTESKKAFTSRSTTQSFLQHRSRHAPTASKGERP